MDSALLVHRLHFAFTIRSRPQPDHLQHRRRTPRPDRRHHLVDSGSDSLAQLLHPAVPHVQGQGAAGGGRILRFVTGMSFGKGTPSAVPYRQICVAGFSPEGLSSPRNPL